MSLSEIKKKMLLYRDFYGGDLISLEDVESTKTKRQLSDLLERHRSFMECMLSDANSHLDSFKRELGLDDLP